MHGLLRTLRLFIDVARCRSFSTGADMHGITQGAASQRIHQLEEELGVTLFDRSRRPMELTVPGQAFLEGCQDLTSRYERLNQHVSSLAHELNITLHIAAIYSTGIELLESVREAIQNEHPHSTIKISYRNPDEVERRTLHGECELGIISYPAELRKLDHRSLREDIMVVACSAEHPLAQKTELQAQDLRGHDMLAIDPSLPMFKKVNSYLREHHSPVNISDTFDNIDTLIHAIGPTHQFAVLPEMAVKPEVESGRLVSRPLHPQLRRPIGIVSAKGSKLSRLAQTFIDELNNQTEAQNVRAVS